MPVSLEEFAKMLEEGEGQRGKYDWSKLDALIEKGEPFTVADVEALMPEVPNSNYIRQRLEKLVKQGKLVRTPKYRSRTYYVKREAFEEFMRNKARK